MACSSQLYGNIALECTSNKGGIRRVWLTAYKEGGKAPENNFKIDTVTMTGTEGHVIELPKEISYTPSAATWYEFAFRKGTSQFTTTFNRDDANGTQYYTTEITMTFSKMETQKRLAIASLALSDVLVVVEDNNGNFWGFGYDGEGATLSANTGQTGTAKTDSNSYSITLTADSDALPLQLNDAALESFLPLQ